MSGWEIGRRANQIFRFLVFFLMASFSVVLVRGENRGMAPAPQIAGDTASLPKNVIVIVVDALRRDHLGAFGYVRKTSATIDRLSREGVLFSDVVSQAPQTAPSVASLFTGLNPYKHGVELYSYNQSFHPLQPDGAPFLADNFKTLAEYFAAAGFMTLGLNANPWLQAEYNFGRGFENYEYMRSWDGRTVNAHFRAHRKDLSANRPFFAYLHYMDVHAPYYQPDTFHALYTPFKGDHVFGCSYFDTLTETDVAYSMALYDERINVLDGLLADLLGELKEAGVLDRTMLVITSDHGEEFSEHGGMGHGTSLYAEQINTFFILWDPGRLPAKRIPRKVRTIDFFPTILALAGIKPEASKIDGLNLGPLIRGGVFPESNNIPVISELGDKKAVFLEGWKYIFDIFLKTDELFNEAEDKGDSINLADRENRRRDKMRQYLAANCDERTPDRKAVPALAEEMKKEIRSLGYVGGTAEVGPTIGYRDLNSAVTDRIDAGGKAFNPLQFEFGWYGRETAAGSPYFCVGPHVRLFLKKANRTQAELVIEGKVDLEKLGRKAQHIRLSSEGRLLGEAVITETGPFTMSAKVPPDMGKDRPLELVILCDGYYREKGANGANILISLDVSTIHFR